MLKRFSWLLMLLAALSVAAPALAEGPSGPGATNLNTVASVSGATVTLTGATGRNVRIYGVWAFCSAGVATLYISDSTNTATIWQSVTGAVTTAMFTAPSAASFTNNTPIWGATSATLTVRLVGTAAGGSANSCSTGVPGTIEVFADRY